MSDIDTAIPEQDTAEQDVQTGEVDGAETADVPQLNVDEYGDYLVPVKINGEVEYVPFAEAVNGYQRQADYTRKSQEVAAQRQELQVAAALNQALQNDPEGTLQALTQHYGYRTAPAAPPPVQQAQSWEQPEWDQQTSDPRLQSLESRLAAFEQAQAQQQMEATLTRLQTKYGEAFDQKEVLSQAIAMRENDLEKVFKLIDYDRKTSTPAPSKVAPVKKAAPAVKEAAAAVSGGRSANANSSVDEAPIRSIADAWALARKEHGV